METSAIIMTLVVVVLIWGTTAFLVMKSMTTGKK